MRRLLVVLLIALLGVAGCSSTSDKQGSPKASAPISTATTPTTPATPTISPSSTPPAHLDLGFDFVYDTVTEGFTQGQVWINRRGVSQAVPGHGYGLINPIPAADGKSLLVKRIAEDGDPGSGDIAVIDLAGNLIKAIPGTDGCFPGGWAHGRAVLGCGVGTDASTFKAYLVKINDGTRKVIGPTCPGCGGASVSPDGKTIQYDWNDKVSFLPITLGKPTMTITHSPGGQWTPDGKHLLVATDNGQGKSMLVLMNLDGTGRHTVARFDWQQDLSYMSSPDGKHIVFAGSSDTPNSFWEVGTDGKGLHQLSPALVGGDPAVLP